ncbi:unnamed protein product [Durusdinium trenchii]|uniref:Uncharacterized protein n=2 Tax=Durusdinium trenchii TaxID=1381693 RepID=A0ABP0S2Y4_9DINO
MAHGRPRSCCSLQSRLHKNTWTKETWIQQIEVIVPFWEKSEKERQALRCATAPARPSSQIFRTISASGLSRDQRRARLAMSCSTPLHGVSSQRNALFADWIHSTLQGPSARRLSQSQSAAELLSEPGMSMVTRMVPERANMILPSWTDRKQQTRMVWVGMEREKWDTLDARRTR